MAIWKYKVQELKFPMHKVDEAIERQLSVQGQDGWELVAIERFQGLSPSWLAIYKKPAE